MTPEPVPVPVPTPPTPGPTPTPSPYTPTPTGAPTPDGASECVEFPVVISYPGYDFIVMPPGSNPAMPRSDILRRLGTGLGIAGLLYDIVEMMEIFTPVPGDEDLTAVWDVGVTYLSGLFYGTNYLFERPHPDLPLMVTINQDVLVTGGDLVVAAGTKYVLGPGGGGAAGNVPGAGAGYVAGLGTDIVTTGASIYHDYNRTFGDWPMHVSVGLTVRGRPVVLWWPQEGGCEE